MRGQQASKKSDSSDPRCGDPFVLADWFASDPAACVKDREAQQVLRSLQHSIRPWVKLLDEKDKQRIEAVQELQRGSWWEALRERIHERLYGIDLSENVATLFADYLSGYFWCCDIEPQREGPEWRRAKQLRRKLSLEPGVSAHAPHREHLKTKLIRLMTKDLVADGHKREYTPDILAKVWGLVGKDIKPASTGRSERRSRRRTRLTT